MTNERSIFDQPHHQSLELLAAQALAAGNIATAFKLADRRCRVSPPPEPHCYVLRAEALFNLGAETAAIADVAKALEIAPDNVPANRRMLAWAHGSQQLQAALAIIDYDRNLSSVRSAARILHQHGQRSFAHVTVFHDAIEGWAVWENEAPLDISISDGTAEITARFEADAFHPLAEYGQATSFRIRRPKSRAPQVILLLVANNVFYSTRIAGNEPAPKTKIIWPRPQDFGAQQVRVIVPVFADYNATRLCLETLLKALKASGHRAIIVDDATPEPRIAEYLTELSTEACIELIVNAHNLGFIGSVNRVLESIQQGDVVILNSDTVVPRDFITQLAAAARSSPDIGTVTPLSNNGEFVSFPIPFTANPLESRREVERINAIAAAVNADKIIDIPSGVGFCLYVTRACLDRVGPLSEDFARGYLEDVDFCLRAREQGFRNICAPSVYVGHSGSKSFASEKRSLVVRNLRVLERRFPYHRAECAAFIEADPLRVARQAVERAAASVACHPRLLVAGTGAVGAIARHRAGEVASATEPVVILEVHCRADGTIIETINAAGEMPQSLQFDLSSSSELKLLVDFIKSNEPSRIEILDPANTPLQLIDVLVDLKVPYDVVIADAGILGRHDQQFSATAGRALATSADDRRGKASAAKAATKHWTERWQQIANGAQRIVVLCREAEAFAKRFLSQPIIDKIDRAYESHSRAVTRTRRKAPAPHLGFVPLRSCAHEQWLMRETARQLNARRPEIVMTVIGAALDDLGLMRGANVFVTGVVEPEEFQNLADALGVEQLFICTTRPLFGHPITSVALSSRRPTAYFDWSMGYSTRKGNLAIDPGLPLDDVISVLDQWIPKPRRS